MSIEPKAGRFEGDYRIEVHHNPYALRKPWRVIVWEWRRPWSTAGEEPAWRVPMPICGGREPEHEREFRSLARALTYRSRAQDLADAQWISHCALSRVERECWERAL